MAQDINLLGATYTDVPAVDLPKSGGGTARFTDMTGVEYAASNEVAGNAIRANGILFGEVDSTSTSTVFTVTIDGVTEYYDGLTIMLKNGVVTSATNFTININGLGAKGVYSNMAAATRETSIFNINYTLLLVYDSTRVSGGCWVNYRGYYSDANTIGYQLRTNSTALPVTDTARYYKIYFSSPDGAHWIPASVNSTNNATAIRPVNQRPINPFGRIVYTSATTNFTAGSNLTATTIWSQYVLVLGYSFNRTGAALELTVKEPVYVKCAPQSDGSAIIDADTPYVQELPTTEDGKIYIYLGVAYEATRIELYANHPVYYYKDGCIRLWTNAAASGASVDPATASPVMDGTAAVGTSVKYAREDHVHPTDTSRQAALVSGTNIKTINGNSLLGSGDLAISGGSSVTTLSLTIPVSGWGSSKTYTAYVSGVTATNAILVASDPSCISEYSTSGVYCSAQTTDALTFTCLEYPATDLTVNVMIFD